jgi:predicted nucleic acid-binding Zn ribbon protein
MTGKAAPVHPRLAPKETPDAPLLADWLSKNPVTRPTPKHARRHAKKEETARSRASSVSWETYFSGPRRISPNEALGYADRLTSGRLINPLSLYDPNAPSLDAPVLQPPPAWLEPIQIPGLCLGCGKRLPRRTRSDTKFCSEACKKALQRKRKAREEAERVFKKTALEIAQNTGAGNLVEDYYQTACVMSADDVTFLGTPYGMVAIEDVPGAAKAALSPRDRFSGRSLFCRPILPATEHSSTGRDITVAIEAAKVRSFGWSYIERERQSKYLKALDNVSKGPKRKVLVFTFGEHVPLTEEQIAWQLSLTEARRLDFWQGEHYTMIDPNDVPDNWGETE